MTSALRPRRLDFDLEGADVSTYWYDGDPFKSHFFHAFSLTLPLGEGEFMRSVRAVESRITDLDLKEQVRGFCQQEGNHAVMHQKMNSLLIRKGYDLVSMEGDQRWLIRKGRKHCSDDFLLAMTVAGETYTMRIARMLLEGQILTNADERMKRFWEWHAIEELEHRSVAFDVYENVCGKTSIRFLAIVSFTLAFWILTLRWTRRLLAHDGLVRKPKIWISGAYYLLRWNGIAFNTIRGAMRFMLPGYHPGRAADDELLRAWDARLFPPVPPVRRPADP